MSLSASTSWNVRTGGSDTANAGGFRYGAQIAAPSAPTVNQSGSGGTVAAGTYYCVVTYTDGNGETVISPQTSVTTTGTTSTITVTAPGSPAGALTWAAYFGTTSGGPYFPQGTSLVLGVNRVVTTTPPTSGTQPRGVDYTLQDPAQISVTDAVANGTTTVTSSTAAFTGAHVGNVAKINGAYYDIVSVTNATTILVDRTITTGSSLALIVGGAFASPGQAASLVASGHIINVKAGTYSIGTGTANTAGNKIALGTGTLLISGYGTTPGDLGTKPVFQAGGNSITLLSFSNAHMVVENIEFTKGSANTILALNLGSTGNIARYCKINGTDNGGITMSGDCDLLQDCEVTGTSGGSAAINHNGSGNRFIRVVSHGNSNYGFRCTSGTGDYYEECISFGNTNHGFYVPGNDAIFVNCVSYGNTGAGINGWEMSTRVNVTFERCIAVNNGTSGTTYGFNCSALNPNANGCSYVNCATYGQTNATGGGYVRNISPIALTGDPFVSGSTNFGLNNTSGAGAACRGLQTAFPGLASTITHLDAGAAQHQDAAAGGTPHLAGRGGGLAG